MNIKEASLSFEKWRKEQIASLVRTGHVEAARAFEQLGSIHWKAWQSAWKASREALVIEMPSDQCIKIHGYSPSDTKFYCRKAIEAAGLKVKS